MERDYIIATASTADLTDEYLKEHNIPFIKYSYTVEDKLFYDDCKESSRDKVYKDMRNGAILTTSAINTFQYKEFFEDLIKKENKNIIFMDMSKAMSASHKFADEAIEELKSDYPSIKIIYVDTVCISGGLGLLVTNVVEKYENGASFDELLFWIEENKLKIAHRFTVDDLSYLKRGGRVSNSAALIGTLLNIKPVLYVPNEGTLVVSSKVRGRKKALSTIINSIKSDLEGVDTNGMVFHINHADCLGDAEFVRNSLFEAFPNIKEVSITGLGVVIGAHCGPGLLAIFYIAGVRNA